MREYDRFEHEHGTHDCVIRPSGGRPSRNGMATLSTHTLKTGRLYEYFMPRGSSSLYGDGSDLPPSPTELPSDVDFSINGFVDLANCIAESLAKSKSINVTGEYHLLCICTFFDDKLFFTWFSER